jgi:hypothetical protein
MSYDVNIGDVWINHTYNGCGACKEILGFTPKEFDGKKASDVLLLAIKVKNELEANPEHYDHYMPNNWGSVKSWINFMNDIIKACETHPNEIVEVN